MLALGAGGCVSDTLSQQNTAPQPIAQQETPNYDPAQREAAIAEIRAKAEQPASGELTNAYATADGPNEPMTPQKQAEMLAQMERDAQANASNVADAELAEKQRSINEMRNQAKSHYNNAVSAIQN